MSNQSYVFTRGLETNEEVPPHINARRLPEAIRDLPISHEGEDAIIVGFDSVDAVLSAGKMVLDVAPEECRLELDAAYSFLSDMPSPLEHYGLAKRALSQRAEYTRIHRSRWANALSNIPNGFYMGEIPSAQAFLVFPLEIGQQAIINHITSRVTLSEYRNRGEKTEDVTHFILVNCVRNNIGVKS